MKVDGIYQFRVANLDTGENRNFEFRNYITKAYRYFNDSNYLYSFIPAGNTIGQRITYTFWPTLYLHFVLADSNFNNPIVLEEPFYEKNIAGKTLTVDVDYKTVTAQCTKDENIILDTNGVTKKFEATAVNGPFSFRACLAGTTSFSGIWSALNFPEIVVADNEILYVTYSILNRW